MRSQTLAMYIPKHYKAEDQKEVVTFMKRFNFATIISTKEGLPIATHLPFIISEKDEKIIVTSHFSKANEHWKSIEKTDNLIIFTEPHAYISPSNYDKKQNVPTWNYIAIHAYGKARLIHGRKAVFEVLDKMMDNFEPAYKEQWTSLSSEYKNRMAEGIVAFEIEISDLQSKEKLSQNKKINERENIINSLSKSEHENERTIADYMNKKIKKT